jgi:hypothetical protein
LVADDFRSSLLEPQGSDIPLFTLGSKGKESLSRKSLRRGKASGGERTNGGDSEESRKGERRRGVKRESQGERGERPGSEDPKVRGEESEWKM